MQLQYGDTERETEMSDFARPPEKPPRAGKDTFGQTSGASPTGRTKKTLPEKRRKEKKKNGRKPWLFTNFWGLVLGCIGATDSESRLSFRIFEIYKNFKA